MITVAGVRVTEARLLIPAIGAWQAECILDIDTAAEMPTGRVTIDLGSEQLVGTVDASGSGRYGTKGSVRVVAGAGAWTRIVTRQGYPNDAGVTTADIVNATASEIGESAVVPAPTRLGVNYVRLAGPASRVLSGVDWFVDAAGVTQVKAREPRTLAPESYDLLEWYPEQQLAIVGSQAIVWPGSILVDDRIGTFVVRDVEIVFRGDGAGRANLWTGDSDDTDLSETLRTMVEEFSDRAHVVPYRYVVIGIDVDGRLELQSQDPVAPDVQRLAVWPGMAGDSCNPTPGSEVLVDFIAGDPAQPIVRGFANEAPLERVIDATTAIKVGANAVSPIAQAVKVDANFAALKVLATALGTYATAIQAIADPTDVATPVLTAAITAFNAAVQSTPAQKGLVE